MKTPKKQPLYITPEMAEYLDIVEGAGSAQMMIDAKAAVIVPNAHGLLVGGQPCKV